MVETFSAEILGNSFVYRPARRKELDSIRKLEGQCDTEVLLCKYCVIEPVDFDYDNCLAALPKLLSDKIIEVSIIPEETKKRYQESAEEWFNTQEAKVEILMMAVLGLSPEIIENLSLEDWYKYGTAAQLAAPALYGTNLQNFLDLDLSRPQKKAKPPPNIPPRVQL